MDGFTYLGDRDSPIPGFEVSGKVIYEFNTNNPATNYRSGQILSFHYLVGQYLAEKLEIGVNGRYGYQTTKDTFTNQPPDFDGQRVRQFTIGPAVALFTASGVRQALHNGRIQVTDGSPRAGRLLSHLPRKAWALGLLLGLGIACVLTPLTFGLFHALGFSGLPFAGFALFKAIYTAPPGFVVTRWVILRQLLG